MNMTPTSNTQTVPTAPWSPMPIQARRIGPSVYIEDADDGSTVAVIDAAKADHLFQSLANARRYSTDTLKRPASPQPKPTVPVRFGSPQVRKVYNHLKSEGSITNVEAQNVHKIRALPRRISDLEEKHGVSIGRQHKTDVTGQRYTKYFLKEAA
jgi:hypothetical protein